MPAAPPNLLLAFAIVIVFRSTVFIRFVKTAGRHSLPIERIIQ